MLILILPVLSPGSIIMYPNQVNVYQNKVLSVIKCWVTVSPSLTIPPAPEIPNRLVLEY